MKRIKKVLFSFFILLICFSLCTCGINNSSTSLQSKNTKKEFEPNPYARYIQECGIDGLDDYQLMEILVRYYSLADIIEMSNARDDYIKDFLYEFGIPNMELIMEEMKSQGYADDIEVFIELLDKIGYMPSSVFGNYIADEKHVIHTSNGPCFSSIPPRELIYVGLFTNIEAVQREIDDDDTNLAQFTLCPKCIEIN